MSHHGGIGTWSVIDGKAAPDETREIGAENTPFALTGEGPARKRPALFETGSRA